MIDLDKATSEFDKYVRKYDMTNKIIKLKYHHTYKVVQLSEELAKSLNLSDEDIKLAKLIGLLHDIARFEDDKYDNLILIAIKNHNKYKIEDNLPERELLFSKIIKDADKLDIFSETLNCFYKKENEIDEIENGVIDEQIIEQIKQNVLVKRKPNSKSIDRLLINLAFTFDFYFEYSFKTMKEADYINKIIDRFNYKNQETKIQMEKIRNLLNQFIKEKIKDDRI